MNIKINRNFIIDVAKEKRTFDQGAVLYELGKVASILRDTERTAIIIEIKKPIGKEIVTVKFNADSEIENIQCTCERNKMYGEPCEHIIAGLLAMEFEKNENQEQEDNLQNQLFYRVVEFDKDQSEEKTIKSIRYAFDRLNLEESLFESKKLLNLEISVRFSPERFQLTSRKIGSVSFKIGLQKLYTIKSLNSFFDARAAQNTVIYGKDFIYNPVVHEFSPTDTVILNTVEALVNLNATYRINYYTHYGATKLVDGKQINLISDASIKQFLGMMVNKPFHLNIEDRQFNVQNLTVPGVIEDAINMPFSVIKIEEAGKPSFYKFASESHQLPYPITGDFEYIYFNQNIYHLNERQRKTLAECYRMLLHEGESLTVPEEQAEHFVQAVYPFMKQLGTVTLDTTLKEKIVEFPLVSKVYFDRGQKGIKGRVEFCYGNKVINPLEKKENTEQIIVRNRASEAEVKSYFKGFKSDNGNYILENDHDIFEFLQRDMGPLQSLADVYYSEDFKNIKIPFPKIRSKIQLTQGSMLDVSFEIGDFDKREISQLFKALKQKKKYYRLKNGSFLDLTDEESLQMTELAARLDIADGDWQKDKLHLSLNRALLLEDIMESMDQASIERSYDYKNFLENMRNMTLPDIVLPQKYEGILRDYQKTGFYWLKTLAHYKMGGILADDMGLGKTVQAIAFIDSAYESHHLPTLIIAPTSLIYNWEDEVKKFAPHLKVLVVTGNKNEREQLMTGDEHYHLIITSYPLIRRDIEQYQGMQFAYCMIDEAQHIKNALSKTAETVKQIKAEGFFALTGTPIENNLTELWSLFDFVMPGFLGNLNHFIFTFEKPIIEKNTRVLQRLKKQISPFIMRRMKVDVLKELPPKIETKMIAHMGEEQKKVYMAYLEEIKQSLAKDLASDGFGKSQIKILAYLTRLRQICCHPSTFIDDYHGGSGKLDLLQEILLDAITANHKVLIFSQFTKMLDIIGSLLEQLGIDYSYLDGSVKAIHRKDMVNAFNKGNVPVFLISLKAGGTGLNLTSADIVIHYDPWWNPAVEDQATDRAYRIGQLNTVQVFKLIAQGTIEEKIFELQNIKKEMIANVIEPGETFLTKMTEEDIKALFT